MFSGVIKESGELVSVRHESANPDGALRLAIRSSLFSTSASVRTGSPAELERGSRVVLGSSVSANGVCLTVSEFIRPDVAVFEVGSETLRRTTLGRLPLGTKVNLERSIAVGELLEGHLVLGHVDCVAKLVARKSNPFSDSNQASYGTVRFDFELPAEISVLVATKGSVAIDGVSLTVGDLIHDRPSGNSSCFFSVYVIPFTLNNTTFARLDLGDYVNIEVDPLARYVARQLAVSRGGR